MSALSPALSLQLGAYDVFGEGAIGAVFPQHADKRSIVLGADESAYLRAVLVDRTCRSAELSPDESIRDFLLMVI